MLDEMLKRLPETAKEEREIVTTAFGLAENFKAKASEIRGNADLSSEGKARQVAELAKGAPLAHLRQLADRASKMDADVTNLRQAMQPEAPDRADMYGQAERHRLLDFARALPPAERLRLAMEDEAFQDAVLAHHPRLSGLSTEQLDQVKAAYTQRLHGAQIAGLDQRAEIVDVVKSALKIATSDFIKVSGLAESEVR